MLRRTLAAMILVGAGCTTAPVDDGAPLRALTPSTTTVVPDQIVLLNDANASFAAPTYAAQFAGVDVTVVRVSPTELGVIVPAVAPSPSGWAPSALEITADGVAYVPVELTVGAQVALPAAPADVLASTVAAAQAAAGVDPATLDSFSTALIAAVQPAFASARAQLATLSADQQQTLAAIIVANPSLFAGGEPPADAATALAADALQLDALVVLDALAPTTNAALAAISLYGNAAPYAHDLATTLAAPFIVAVANPDSRASSTNGNVAVLAFTPGAPRTLSVTGEQRTVCFGDLASTASAPALAAAAHAVEDFDNALATLSATHSLGATPLPAAPVLPAQTPTTTIPIDTSRMLLLDVSGANVASTGFVVHADSTVTVTFTGPDQQAFAFDLVYAGDVASETMTILAKFN